MKKSLQFLMIALMVSFIGIQADAQLPDGSDVPLWTGTDINGNEHSIADYLEDGKTVFIDVSATWCGPCWGFHTAGTLEAVYEELGPDGTDQAMVFFIEGDDSTTQADLEGTGGNTQGDWVTGVEYPIIDDGAVANQLGISYYPTIYAVCPSGKLIEIGQADVSAFIEFAEGCPQAGGMNNAAVSAESFLISPDESAVICGEFEPSLFLHNLGEEDLTSATLELIVDGSVEQTMMWEGDLSPLDSELVYFDPISVSGDNADVEVIVSSPNGEEDENADDNTATIEINAPKSSTDDFTLTIQNDQYGYEIYWAFLDESGDIIAEGGNTAVGLDGGGLQAQDPGGYGANELVVEEVTLDPLGCYEFVIVDDWGDGIYAPGYFTLEDADGNVMASAADGSFSGVSMMAQFERTDGASAPAPNADFSVELDGNQVLVTDNSDNASTYSWDFGDGSDPVTGATPDAHEYTENGDYTITLTITNADGVEDTFEQTVTVSGVSINNIAGLTAVEVYPNPASDELNVAFQLTETTNMTIELTNVVGQTVKAVSTQNFGAGNTNVSIDLNDLSNGLYFVTFRSENGISNQKFMVSK